MLVDDSPEQIDDFIVSSGADVVELSLVYAGESAVADALGQDQLRLRDDGFVRAEIARPGLALEAVASMLELADAKLAGLRCMEDSRTEHPRGVP
jgi:hypothetical protein